VNLIDSSAWLEYFAAGPPAGQFSAVIEKVEKVLVPTIVLVEVTRRVLQQRGEDAALQIAAMLHQGQVVVLDSGTALSAAQFGVAHGLPLADSIIYATAQQNRATVWTMDPHFADLPGVRYIARQP